MPIVIVTTMNNGDVLFLWGHYRMNDFLTCSLITDFNNDSHDHDAQMAAGDCSERGDQTVTTTTTNIKGNKYKRELCIYDITTTE